MRYDLGMNRTIPAILATTGLLLAGCGDDDDPSSSPSTTSAPTGTTQADGAVETADGRERPYRIHVPESVGEEPVALLVALHGGGGSADQFAGENGLEALADEEGFVVVHPEGISGRAERLHTWNAGNCCGAAAQEGVDDVAFVRAVVEEVAGALPIDADRVFAIGHSNGGMLAYRLACEAADVFAAVGLQAGALGIDSCDPAEPVSLIHVHGTADTSVLLEGGVGSGVAGVAFRSTAGSLAAVTSPQGCDDEPVDEVDGANPALSTSTWSCPEGAEVRLALVEGGAHGWFGGARADRRDGPAVVDSSLLIWDFLRQHPRR
jgi:polyhydroxybutyrate depolymerase